MTNLGRMLLLPGNLLGFLWSPVTLILLLLFSPASCSTAGSAKDSLTLTEHDNGRTVTLAKGAALTLRLEASPGTGYGWQIQKNEPELLKLIGEPAFEKSDADRPNASEQEVFHFRASALGSAKLELVYARPWEKDKPPAKTFRIEAVIR